MPCLSDPYSCSHDMPTLFHDTAKLLVWIGGKLGVEVGPGVHEAAKDKRTRSDFVPLLCETIKSLSETERDALIYGDPRDPMARKLADWWEEHLEVDRQRQEKEAEEERRQLEADRKEYERLKAKLGVE